MCANPRPILANGRQSERFLEIGFLRAAESDRILIGSYGLCVWTAGCPDSRARQRFGQPCLVGLRHVRCDDDDRHSIFHGVKDYCDAARWRLKEGDRVSKSKLFQPGDFAERIEYLANPNPSPVILFSQLTMDD
jgi:hypothetical protein